MCPLLTSGSSPPTPCSLFDGGPEVQQLQSVKDFGISLECSLKPSAHCIAAVKKPSAALFLVRWNNLVHLQTRHTTVIDLEGFYQS